MNPENQTKIFKYGLGGALIEAAYIILLAILLPKLEHFVPEPSIWPPMVFLMIFVFSAGFSALLILGYPVYLIVNQKNYRDAITTLGVSLATLLICALLVFSLIIIINR